MRRQLYYLSLAGLALFALSCEPESEMVVPNKTSISTADLNNFTVATEKIDFDKGNFSAGDIVSEIFCPDGQGPIVVTGMNPNFPGDNAAMIFDSSNPTGGDFDLGTPNEMFGGPGQTFSGDPEPSNDEALNNILIITEDFDSGDPDDVDVENAGFEFDFSALGSVTLFAMDLLDIDGESAGAFVQLLDGDGNELLNIGLPETGCNGVALVNLGPTSGVAKMIVVLNGSGAIDNICYEKEDPGCTFTLGYWKTHAVQGAAGFDPTWNLLGAMGENEPFFLSGGTYYDAISTAPAGNAYYQLSQQYVAAVLNGLSGASTSDVSAELAQATGLFATFTPAQIGALRGNNATRKLFISLSETLDDYNNGVIGPGHCDDNGDTIAD